MKKKKPQKRKFFNLIVLFLILSVVTVYYFLKLKNSAGNQPKKDTAHMVSRFVLENVIQIKVSYFDGTNHHSTDLKQVSNIWVIQFPFRETADEETVLNLLQGLKGLEAVETYQIASSDKLKEYGFDKPKLRISIDLEPGVDFELFSGGETSTGEYQYVLSSMNSNAVYLIKRDKMVPLLKGPADFRSKRIFSLPVSQMKEIDIVDLKRSRYTFQVNQQGGQVYSLVYPKKGPVDTIAVKSKIMDIYPINVRAFLETNRSLDLMKHYGFGSSGGSIRFQTIDNKKEELFIGKQGPEGYYYGYQPNKAGFFIIDDAELKKKLDFSGIK